MEWTAAVDFVVGIAQIALFGWLAYGAVLAAIAAFRPARNSGKHSGPRDRFGSSVESVESDRSGSSK